MNGYIKDDNYDIDNDELEDEGAIDYITDTDENDEYAVDLDGFRRWLKDTKTNRKGVRADSSIKRYCESMAYFMRLCESDKFSTQSISIAVTESKERCLAATTNGLIAAINLYCEFVGKKSWKTSRVKVQRKQFLDDILSMADYEFVLKKAKALNKWKVYLYARIAGTTGMRLCEMLQIKREHIQHGCVDLYGKGAKQRRIYFPKAMQGDILKILDETGIKSGYVFPTSGKHREDAKRGIQAALDRFCGECELPKGLLHPHGFRHFFAKEFVRKYQNIALLADLLGHSSIETTRIYLKYTSREQKDIVNEVVTW